MGKCFQVTTGIADYLQFHICII